MFIRIAIASVMAFSLLIIGAQIANAAAVRTNTGFTTTTFLPNDDGTYPTNGPDPGVPPGTPVAQSFGFTINFFGESFSSGYINNNGNLTFETPLPNFTPFGITGGSTPMLAPFFADVDTRSNSGLVTFGTDTVGGRAAFGINWIDVNYFDASGNHPADSRNTFQLVLIDRSDVASGDFDFEFNFDKIAWETGEASGGNVLGLGGDSARVGWTNGAGEFFELSGSGVSGSFIDTGVLALIADELSSALSVGGAINGRYFFQVRNGEVVPPDPDGVPEPMSLALLGLGLAGLGAIKRRRFASSP